MTYRFSLILNREVTDAETVAVKEASRADMSFISDTLPTNAEVPVTRIDFSDAVAGTLAEAIEDGFTVVKSIPELSIPGLRVPAQPAVPAAADEEAGKEKAEATS